MWVSLITLKLRPNKPAKIVGLQVGNDCGAPTTSTFSVSCLMKQIPSRSESGFQSYLKKSLTTFCKLRRYFLQDGVHLSPSSTRRTPSSQEGNARCKSSWGYQKKNIFSTNYKVVF